MLFGMCAWKYLYAIERKKNSRHRQKHTVTKFVGRAQQQTKKCRFTNQ